METGQTSRMFIFIPASRNVKFSPFWCSLPLLPAVRGCPSSADLPPWTDLGWSPEGRGDGVKVPCIPACAGGHPPQVLGSDTGKEQFTNHPPPPFFQQPSTGQVRQAQGKTQDEAGFPSPAAHGQAGQQSPHRTVWSGRSQGYPRVRRTWKGGVKANCLEAGRAPGSLSWRGSQMEKPGDGGGRSQWLPMSVILTLSTHRHEEQRAKSKGVTLSLSW